MSTEDPLKLQDSLGSVYILGHLTYLYVSWKVIYGQEVMFILVLKEVYTNSAPGNSVPFIGSMCSLWYFSHMAQFRTTLVMSWEIPGHHTEEAAFARVLVIPWWPSWRRLNTSALSLGGIIIRRPLRSRLSWREMLPRSLQYLAIGPWTLRFSSGHPFCTYCITVLSVSSFFNSERISSNRWSEAGRVTNTAFT